MRALVMAAGLGTRLRPLTDHRPKPLVPVLGRPMVEYGLEQLARAGVAEGLINIHYLPNQLREFVAAWNVRGGVPRLGMQDETARILETGGAIALGATWLFERDREAFVYNSDVIATPDLLSLLTTHRRLREAHGVLCTLAVTPHPEAGSKYTGLRVQGGRITGFEKKGADPGLRHFPGFYVIEREAAARLPAAGQVSSVVEQLWKPLAAEGKLGAWDYNGAYYDLGTPEDLRAAEMALESTR